MIFYFIAAGSLTLFYFYIGLKLIALFEITLFWQFIFWFIIAVLCILPVGHIFLRIYGFESFLSDMFAWIGFLFLGFFSLMFVFFAVEDLALLSIKLMQKIIIATGFISNDNIKDVQRVNVERRLFLIGHLNMGIVAVAGLITCYGFFKAIKKPEVKNIRIPFENLHEDLKGFTIVQITDIHVGPTIKNNYVQTIVNQVNQLKPDVIVFTGDLADGSPDYLKGEIAPFAKLYAPFGKFFVTGNHDYYSGVEGWINHVEKLGFTVLLNENRMLQCGSGIIALAGVTDFRSQYFLQSHVSDPKKALEGALKSHIRILLAHQPLSIYKAAEAGYDLQISGHTHGGQYFPGNFFVKIQQPFVSGLHRYKKTWIYVSCGTGYWGPPIRFGVNSEITVIKLA